jgi:hypothetical protein
MLAVKIPEPNALPKPDIHRSVTAVLPDRWSMRLQFAATEGEVVRIAKDFVSSWADDELFRLPKECQPPAIWTVHDINGFAYALTRAQLAFEGPLGTGMLIDRMTVFFAYAATRSGQLLHLARAQV